MSNGDKETKNLRQQVAELRRIVNKLQEDRSVSAVVNALNAGFTKVADAIAAGGGSGGITQEQIDKLKQDILDNTKQLADSTAGKPV